MAYITLEGAGADNTIIEWMTQPTELDKLGIYWVPLVLPHLQLMLLTSLQRTSPSRSVNFMILASVFTIINLSTIVSKFYRISLKVGCCRSKLSLKIILQFPFPYMMFSNNTILL